MSFHGENIRHYTTTWEWASGGLRGEGSEGLPLLLQCLEHYDFSLMGYSAHLLQLIIGQVKYLCPAHRAWTRGKVVLQCKCMRYRHNGKKSCWATKVHDFMTWMLLHWKKKNLTRIYLKPRKEIWEKSSQWLIWVMTLLGRPGICTVTAQNYILYVQAGPGK